VIDALVAWSGMGERLPVAKSSFLGNDEEILSLWAPRTKALRAILDKLDSPTPRPQPAGNIRSVLTGTAAQSATV
jgi:hypothetical protein